MRKIFALMLAIAMVLTMVACGKKADNKADSMVTPELYISTVDGKDTVVDKDGKAVTGYTLDKDGNVVDGSGKLELTGSLGDVMKESARAAITCVRGLCDRYGIDKNFYKEKDIHIHFPEGAVPKDGPSAGITMATAIYSALTLKPVRHDIAMTGEITLRGNVLPIGGLKEKSMAAFKNGITTVIIPKDNEPDLEDVDKAVLEKVKFIPVRNFSEVVALAVNNTVRITDNQWNGIDMTAVRSATKTVNAVKQ